MDIAQLKVGAVTVLRPSGPLVRASAEGLLRCFRTALQESMGRVVLDFEAVPFVDSVGLEALMDAADETGALGLSLKVCGVAGVVKEALVATGCDAGLEFHADANAAARSFL